MCISEDLHRCALYFRTLHVDIIILKKNGSYAYYFFPVKLIKNYSLPIKSADFLSIFKHDIKCLFRLFTYLGFVAVTLWNFTEGVLYPGNMENVVLLPSIWIGQPCRSVVQIIRLTFCLNMGKPDPPLHYLDTTRMYNIYLSFSSYHLFLLFPGRNFS